MVQWLGCGFACVAGKDLFPVVPDSLCQSPTGSLPPVGALNHVSVKFKWFL